MPKLNCEAQCCCYNQDHCCSKSNIRVTGNDAVEKSSTKCNNFVKKDRVGSNNVFMTEFASFSNVNKNVSVDCESLNCEHNRNRQCCAGSIKINGISAKTTDETCCDSFRCK